MHTPFPSLPGSGQPKRGLFIDRWGTLMEQPAKGHYSSFNPEQFTPGALDTLFHAAQSGWTIYLIGNEDAVAFGRQSATSWRKLESDLLEHLRSHGIPVLPEGKRPHNKDSVFLLPNTGILYHAAQNDGIALNSSWVIGDSTIELVAGWRAGCRLAGVRTGIALEDGELQVEPDIFADNLASVLHELRSGEGVFRH